MNKQVRVLLFLLGVLAFMVVTYHVVIREYAWGLALLIPAGFGYGWWGCNFVEASTDTTGGADD